MKKKFDASLWNKEALDLIFNLQQELMEKNFRNIYYMDELNKEKEKIHKAVKVLKNIKFYTTPIGQVIHLNEKIKDIEKAIHILEGSDKNVRARNKNNL